MKSLSCVRLLATPQTVAYQAPLSMGFSRQEYWSGVPFPSPNTLYMLPINKSILKAALSHLNFPSDLINPSYRSEFQLLTKGVSSLSVWAGSPGVGFCGAETHQLSHGR